MTRKLLYQTSCVDAVLRLPVTVIDSTLLPEDGGLPNPETEVPGLLDEFPEGDFVIVFFASRAPKTPQMSWLRRVHDILSQDLKKRIRKIYIVHAKWYTRTLSRALTPIVSPKFSFKITFTKNLTELSHYMDITTIDINPCVYKDDIDRTDITEHGMIPVPKQSISIFGRPISSQPNSYWKAALSFLGKTEIHPRLFVPSSRLTEEESEMVDILLHAVSREHQLRLFDYGPVAVLAVLKEYLLSLPEPLLDLQILPMPLQDHPEYVVSVVSRLPSSHLLHLKELLDFCTSLLDDFDSHTMARSLAPSIARLRNPRKEQAAVAVRFFRVALDHWQYLNSKTSPPTELTVFARQPTIIACDEESKDVFDHPNPSNITRRSSNGPLPRALPSEVTGRMQDRPRIPNRRAFGKVAEIMRKYDENNLL